MNKSDWESVIGLEIHAQLNTNTKLFSPAKNEFGGEPNLFVDIFDASMPGTLPVLNKSAVDGAVKTGIAISGTINKFSAFDRKHYFYPDLPSGYQISQFYYPIVSNGKINIEDEDGNFLKTIRINRIHIEQDAGKNIHDLSPKFSYIDLNRAGVPLMEIVSEPDISSAYEAVLYIKKLQLIMRYIKTCDGDMEKGNLRCDANVSVRKKGSTILGTRCEIKNLNSTSNIFDAINFEIERQIKLIESGELVEQQTRLFDPILKETRKLRGKEESMDYRYFADPDLLPIILEEEKINSIRANMPLMPDEKRDKYKKMGLNHEFIKNMVNDYDMGNFFDNVVGFIFKKTDNEEERKKFCMNAANIINIEMCSRLKSQDKINCFSKIHISPNNISKLVDSINIGVINSKIGKEVLDIMFDNKEDLCPLVVIEKNSLSQILDEDLIKKEINEVLNLNQEKLNEYKNGKTQLYQYFIGQIMKKTKGKINPEILNKLLSELINK